MALRPKSDQVCDPDASPCRARRREGELGEPEVCPEVRPRGFYYDDTEDDEGDDGCCYHISTIIATLLAF